MALSTQVKYVEKISHIAITNAALSFLFGHNSLWKNTAKKFPFIKIHDANFVYSGGLWQHEICIEKVFWGISKMIFSASSQWSKICLGYQGIIFNGKSHEIVFKKFAL